jgi:hypothetical protein
LLRTPTCPLPGSEDRCELLVLVEREGISAHYTERIVWSRVANGIEKRQTEKSSLASCNATNRKQLLARSAQ